MTEGGANLCRQIERRFTAEVLCFGMVPDLCGGANKGKYAGRISYTVLMRKSKIDYKYFLHFNCT